MSRSHTQKGARAEYLCCLPRPIPIESPYVRGYVMGSEYRITPDRERRMTRLPGWAKDEGYGYWVDDG